MNSEQNSKGMPLANVTAELSRIVIGKDLIKELLVVALLCEGHVLIEGPVGTAKTTVGRTFAQSVGGTFKRVQCTPDMLPADILGFYLYRPDGSSSLIKGPIFANFVLADELNRTSPRTQAAFLEAMQEMQVTIERETYSLERPFLVIANQVPYGDAGTAPLTTVQLDRFIFRLKSDYPTLDEEDRILQNIDIITDAQASAVTTPADILRLQQEVKEVHVAASIRQYIISILDGLRQQPEITNGPSPRGSIALFRGSRALAFIEGRDFVIPDDVKRLLEPALAHRIRITAEAEMENITSLDIVKRIAAETPVPKVEPR